jgi:V/A-type H+-transporting ATPase subunit C
MAFYGYTNTRIRAMKSILFKREFFEKLLEVKDTSEVINTLGKTYYRKDIETGLLRFPGSQGIEEGLKLNIIKDYQKILKLIKGNSQAERLVKLILSRWDVHNLKTILRGIHSEASKEEISDQLVPVGQLDQAHLNVLLGQDDIKACIDILAMWGFEVAKPLTKVYKKYAEKKKLSVLELAIDRYHFDYMIKNIKKRIISRYNENLMRDYIEREIDLVNIMTLLRLVNEHLNDSTINYSEFFINGGKELSVERLVGLATEVEVESVVEKLSDCSYSPVLKEGLKKYHFTGSLSSLERKIEDYITKKSVGLFKDDPLSISIIVAYIWAKYNETVNLRIILKGKEVEMPEDQIREELVFV